jgi:outer membrane protein assembly factor BamA
LNAVVLAVTLTAAWLVLTLLSGNGPTPCDDTRVGQWTCARAAKSKQLRPAKPAQTKFLLRNLEKLNANQDRFMDDAFGIAVSTASRDASTVAAETAVGGFRPIIGDLSQQSSVGTGIEYGRSEFWKRRIDFHVNARLSARKYQKYIFEAGLPRLFHRRFFLAVTAVQRNYPEQDFFGIGPQSKVSDRSNYALDATDISSAIGWRLTRGARLGIFAGHLSANTGRGDDPDLPSVEQVFHSRDVPGLDQQRNYRYAGTSLDFDYRDRGTDATSGGYYRFVWTYFDDAGDGKFSFRQYAAEARQYFPLLDRARVLSLRAAASLTTSNRSRQIPFFMMGTLGGSESLRGFLDGRFHDRNFLLLNAEYRWAVFTYMDAVLFADAGKVFPFAGSIGLDDLRSSYGFGARFKTPKGPLLRIEFGSSHENHRLHFVFQPAF